MKTKLKDIILLSTSFKRETVLEYGGDDEIETKIDIQHGVSQTGNFQVHLVYKMQLDTKKEDGEKILQFFYESHHVAQFEIEDLRDEDKDEMDRLANVNIAAIIFPFIRENAATISAKAAMAPILISMINFIELYNNKKIVKSNLDLKKLHFFEAFYF